MENNQNMAIEFPGEWAFKKVLGPTFDEIGNDLARVYVRGRDLIFSAARKKIPHIEDGKQANLRVARDILWNGAFSDELISAEYFGGILAASRTEDGRSDETIPFVDVVKAMSSSQLKLHYDIYYSLAKSLRERRAQFDVFKLPKEEEIFISNNPGGGVDLTSLFRLDLISSFSYDRITIGNQVYPYCSARPALFGIMLYATVHNMLERWQAYGLIEFGDIEGIEPPDLFGSSLQEFTRSVEMHAGTAP